MSTVLLSESEPDCESTRATGPGHVQVYWELATDASVHTQGPGAAAACYYAASASAQVLCNTKYQDKCVEHSEFLLHIRDGVQAGST